MNRINALVVAHVVAGIALSWAFTGATNSDLLAVSFAAMFFSQCALLAVWGGFTTARRRLRYAAVGIGTVYLWLVMTVPIGFQNSEDLLAPALLIGLCVVPVVAIFRALQLWGPRLIVCRADQVTSAHQPFQFSIKHLLLLALGVAAALALGRAARSVDPRHDDEWLVLLLICAVLGVCTLHLILAAVWACLAADKIWLRKSLAFAAALPVGLIPAFYFNVESANEFLLCVATAAGGQAVTMLSLDIVRSAGYRIVRTKIAAAQTTPQTEILVAHPLD